MGKLMLFVCKLLSLFLQRSPAVNGPLQQWMVTGQQAPSLLPADVCHCVYQYPWFIHLLATSNNTTSLQLA